MNGETSQAYRFERLGLIISHGPWSERSGREQLDLALAAAVYEIELLLFFVGPGLQQLLAGLDPEAAQLPRGLKAWKSLPELTTTRYLVSAADWERCAWRDWWVEPERLTGAQLLQLQRSCDRLLVI